MSIIMIRFTIRQADKKFISGACKYKNRNLNSGDDVFLLNC